MAELGQSIGEELLKVHTSYGMLVQALLKKFNTAKLRIIKGIAHITGGGFIDNIPRVLPKKCDVEIRKGSWEMLPIFQIIAARSGVPEEELYQVFNMGIGMTLIVDPAKAEAVLRFIRGRKLKAWQIGAVIKGSGRVRMA